MRPTSTQRARTTPSALRLIAGMLAAAVAAFAAGAHGADVAWPSHPVRIVVAQAPDGYTLLIATMAAVTRILREPETVEWADRQGMEIAAVSRADFARTIERDRVRWGEFVGRMRIATH